MTLLLTALVLAIPLAITFAANMGLHHRVWARLSLATMASLDLLIMLLGGFSLLVAAAGIWQGLAGGDTGHAIMPVVILGTGLGIAGLLALLSLMGGVRQAVAHFLPVDPTSPVHTVAVNFAILMMGTSLSGLASLDLMPHITTADLLAPTYADLVVNDAGYILLAVIGVGWLTRRPLPQVAERLGISRPAGREIVLAIILVVAFAVVNQGLAWMASLLWPEDSTTLETIIGQFTANFRSLPGAVAVGIGPGVAEELLFRGALQPRLGLWPTAILFTVAHQQYGLSWAMVATSILAITLGIVRQHMNTSTCIIIHTLYNITAMLFIGM